jgi:hypothetical protein
VGAWWCRSDFAGCFFTESTKQNPFGLSLSKSHTKKFPIILSLSKDRLRMHGHFDKLSSFDRLRMHGHFDKLSADGNL